MRRTKVFLNYTVALIVLTPIVLTIAIWEGLTWLHRKLN